MAGLIKTYLTFYRSPNEASAEERALARMACYVMNYDRFELRCGIWEEFLTAAGRLLFWKGDLLQKLSGSVKRTRNRRRSINLRRIGLHKLNRQITAAQLISPDKWEGLDPDIFAPLHKNPKLRDRFLTDTLAWINAAQPAGPSNLERNVGFLAEGLGLSEAEKIIVHFLAVARDETQLLQMLRNIPAHNRSAIARALSLILRIDPSSARRAVDPSGLLSRLGLIALTGVSDLEDLTRSTNDKLYGCLSDVYPSVDRFLRSFLRAAPQAAISVEDITHMGCIFEVARRVLAGALSSREPGINILLYGFPGAGKTQFARLLAKELSAELFEVAYEGATGESATVHQRLASLILAARALRGRDDAVLVFDEAEDAFPEENAVPWRTEDSKSRASYTKAWMNALLESLEVPVIWIANNISGVDPAYLRRFLMHIRFQELPIPAREKLTQRYFSNGDLSSAARRRVAQLTSLTPAQLESAARVQRLYAPKTVEEGDEVVALQLREMRSVLGIQDASIRRDLPLAYRPDLVNLRPPVTIQALLSGVRNVSRAALCLYGVPGTGKTELVHYLASQLGRELIYKSASDLLTPWVGMTEQRTAEMFAAAEQRGNDVVLLLDEADTFLRDRASARNSWEVSITNEFLARMDNFTGLFVCATNLVDSLDPAVLRRFTLRIELLPLSGSQVMQAFEVAFGRAPSDGERSQLLMMKGLVPADFANVVRQVFMLIGHNTSEPIDMLRYELETRLAAGCNERPMGFVPHGTVLRQFSKST